MLPSVIKAKYVNDYLIEVKFNDGTKKIIDFEGWLTGPVFKPLRNKNYFKKFFIDGPTIAWPNGADIAPETLYEASAVELYRTRKRGEPVDGRRYADRELQETRNASSISSIKGRGDSIFPLLRRGSVINFAPDMPYHQMTE